MKKKINLVLFVTDGNLSEGILKKILKFKKKINILLVVSNIQFKKKLNKNNIKNFKWIKNLKNNQTKILKILNNFDKIDLHGFTFQYKWKIKKKIIDKFKLILNFHFGDIPKYRGHNPIIHAMLNKEKFIFGTVHNIDENFDRGKIVYKFKVENKNIISKEIELKLTKKFIDYFERIIIKLNNKEKIYLKKIPKIKGKFYSLSDIQKLKEVKKFKEILIKSLAFDYPPHEPAFLKFGNTKIYLRIKKN